MTVNKDFWVLSTPRIVNKHRCFLYLLPHPLGIILRSGKPVKSNL